MRKLFFLTLLLVLSLISCNVATTGSTSTGPIHVRIFIHTWFDRSSFPLALDILDEMLTEISSSVSLGLCCDVKVYICVGASQVSPNQHMFVDQLIGFYDLDVQVVDVSHLGKYEWATLNYIEMFVTDPAHQDSYVLYMHTKGTSSTKFQLDRSIIATDRKHFYHFLIKNADVCLDAMMNHGYSTCGVDKSKSAEILYYSNGMPIPYTSMYNGNYWWATSEWLRGRTNVFRDGGHGSSGSDSHDSVRADKYSITLNNTTPREARSMAEMYVLWGVSLEESTQSHYCAFNTNHDGYWCYTDPSSYEHVALLPIRSTGDCHDPTLRLECEREACHCYSNHSTLLVMSASDLYEANTKSPWPLTDGSTWETFVLIFPTSFPSTVMMVGTSTADVPELTWTWDDSTVYYSAITYNLRQNYCQQVPADLRATAALGDCHSPYAAPLWESPLPGHQDEAWSRGGCRERGFRLLHAVTLHVTECGADASWIAEHRQSLAAMDMNSSRVLFFA